MPLNAQHPVCGPLAPIKMKKLLYLTSLIATISCASSSQDQTENNTVESTADTLSITGSVDEKESAILNSDTLVLDKKSVVFFMLNQQEYDLLMTASGGDATDVNEGFADFEYYAGRVSQQMQSKGVDSDVVAHKVFKIVTADGIEYFN